VAYPTKLLHDNEDLVLDLRPHWLALAKPTLALFLACALGIVVAVAFEDPPTALIYLALLLVVAALVWFGIRLLGWSTTNFVLTTDRLISRQGVLTKSGIEIPLERINTVFFNQRLFERLVGAGDLAVESAGERGTNTFTDIRRPADVQREIYVQMEENENRKFDRAAGRAGLSAAEQVEKLHGLLVQGAITQEQYDSERIRLLGP